MRNSETPNISYVILSFSRLVIFVKYASLQRTYTPQMMREVLDRIRNHQIVSANNAERFSNFIQKVESLYNAKAQEDEEWDDAPEEFKGSKFFTKNSRVKK